MRPACHQTLPLQQREICLANRSLGGASDASERGADDCMAGFSPKEFSATRVKALAR